MKKELKAIGLTGILCFSLLFTGIPHAAAKKTDVKAQAMAAYEKILKENPYKDMDGGFTAETFNILDITGDGVPELIINGDAPNIFTYKDGNVVWYYNSWVLGSMYYSEKTNNLMFYYSWNGEETNTIYKYDTDTDSLVTTKELSVESKKYYEYKKGKKIKITKEAYNKNMKKYMPQKEKLETPYKNTEKNRNKYLK